MNHRIRTMMIVTLIALIVTMAYLYYDNTQNVARCQKAGGVWDTAVRICDMSEPAEVPKAP
jgi:hypothetical protein